MLKVALFYCVDRKRVQCTMIKNIINNNSNNNVRMSSTEKLGFHATTVLQASDNSEADSSFCQTLFALNSALYLL